jgi:hypothetical protein
LNETIENVKYTGLRWLRVGYEDDVPVEDFIRLHRQTNVLLSFGLLSGGIILIDLLQSRGNWQRQALCLPSKARMSQINGK